MADKQTRYKKINGEWVNADENLSAVLPLGATNAEPDGKKTKKPKTDPEDYAANFNQLTPEQQEDFVKYADTNRIKLNWQKYYDDEDVAKWAQQNGIKKANDKKTSKAGNVFTNADTEAVAQAAQRVTNKRLATAAYYNGNATDEQLDLIGKTREDMQNDYNQSRLNGLDFEAYNTDEVYGNPKSTADEWLRLAEQAGLTTKEQLVEAMNRSGWKNGNVLKAKIDAKFAPRRNTAADANPTDTENTDTDNADKESANIGNSEPEELQDALLQFSGAMEDMAGSSPDGTVDPYDVINSLPEETRNIIYGAGLTMDDVLEATEVTRHIIKNANGADAAIQRGINGKNGKAKDELIGDAVINAGKYVRDKMKSAGGKIKDWAKAGKDAVKNFFTAGPTPEQQKKQNEFLDNNPTLLKAIFGNSGLTMRQRGIRLAELLMMMGADITKGAYAGFKGLSLPEPTKGKWATYYDNALQSQQKREQEVLDTANKGKADIQNKIGYLKANPTTAVLGDDTIEKLASSNNLSRTDFIEIIENDKNLAEKIEEIAADPKYNGDSESIKKATTKYINGLYNSYKNSVINNERAREQVKGEIEINGMRLDWIKNKNTAINELEKQKVELQKMKLDIEGSTAATYPELIAKYKDLYAGIRASSNAISSTTGTSFGGSASVRGGIPIVSGSASGHADHNTGESESASTTVDELAMKGIEDGRLSAEEWRQAADRIKEIVSGSIDAAVEEIDSQIDEIKSYTNSIDDGIIKGKGVAQKIVRADGTEIALNPDDNIYATTKTITTGKDGGQDVVPMEKEDRAFVLQKRLGYGGNAISKNPDYYLAKLRG